MTPTCTEAADEPSLDADHPLRGSIFHADLQLRFFLNHRRFMRSRRAERNDKSPRELMTGQGHPHWLTLLGLGPLQPRRA